MKQRFKKAINYLKKTGKVKSQNEIADNMDITPQVITEILGGRMNLNAEKAVKFCTLYGFSVEWLLTGEGEMLKSAASGNTINNTGNFCENTIVDYGQQLCELINMQKEMQDMMKEKDRQISDLLTIIKNKGA